MFIILLVSSEIFLIDRKNKIFSPIFKIGYWVQEKFVTSEPDTLKLMQAIETFKILEKAEMDELSDEEMKVFCAKEWTKVDIIIPK